MKNIAETILIVVLILLAFGLAGYIDQVDAEALLHVPYPY
jgi:hypothetical protein